MGADRIRPPDQEWLALHASPEWPRASGAAPASTAAPGSPFVFVSERGAALNAEGFSLMVERARQRIPGPHPRKVFEMADLKSNIQVSVFGERGRPGIPFF
jgi:hypothetical protein